MAWRNGIQNGFYVGPPGDPDGWLVEETDENVSDEQEASGLPEEANGLEKADFSGEEEFLEDTELSKETELQEEVESPEYLEFPEDTEFSSENDISETEEEDFESRIAGEISWSNGICPYCGGRMRPGFYRAAYASGRAVTHQFVPEEEDIPVNTPDFLIYSRLPLQNEGTGFYCEDCGKAFVEFSAPEPQA